MAIAFLKGLNPFASRDNGVGEDVRRIGEMEGKLSGLRDDTLNLSSLMERVGNGESIDGKLKIEAFALVREAAKRVLGQRAYDVQIAGGLAMAGGRIAEMKTGEGKTLVAAFPTYLFALARKGVHVVTVNDYLARRDAEIIGRVHAFLGLSCGVVSQGMEDPERRRAYACGVTYGTNSEIGFDFLRDNLRLDSRQMVQRGHHFAIVDEVDSVLIDEARTPLIISGPADIRAETYAAVDRIVAALRDGDDYKVNEKERAVLLTEEGIGKVDAGLLKAGLVEAGTSFYDGGDPSLSRHVDSALKARGLMQSGRDYIVADCKVVIIDAFTGRMSPGRRFNEGLHQAIEAKEGVEVQAENHTLSSITYQNLFRMYGRLAGMTGTASTEKEEFGEIYGLEVVPVPTNKPIARIDDEDEVYLTEEAKLSAVAETVREAWERGQPVLVGTASVEKSEALARRLAKEGFAEVSGDDARTGKVFRVLNARNHEMEARIVSRAGLPGAVTIATNMAGRGTDIQLGGNAEARIEEELAGVEPGPEREVREAAIREEVRLLKEKALAAGGLFVIGTERHESRRIDNQLRGRSGRQGDPGRSRFYVSLEDDVTRVFATDGFRKALGRIGLAGDAAISHPMVTKGLEKAQRNIESNNYNIRKEVVKYDDVVNEQRKAIHAYRQQLMSDADVSEWISDLRRDAVAMIVAKRIPENSYPEMWDGAGLEADLRELLKMELPVKEWIAEEGVTETEIEERIEAAAAAHLASVEARFAPGVMRLAEKTALMQSLDKVWREHVVALEELRSTVAFRSIAARDPLVEFRTDAYEMFKAAMDALSFETTFMSMRITPMASPA